MAKFGLPGISSKLPADVRQFLERVREAFNGADSLVTYSDLTRAGLAGRARNGDLTPPEGSDLLNLTLPPAPTAVTAVGAMTNILLEWDAPRYGHHSHTEIWASGVDDIGQRVMVGTAMGYASLYAHAVGTAETRYYWVRFISIAGREGPYNAVAGVMGATSQDPAFIIGLLTDEYGGTSEAPFFQIDTATVINGVSVPAGTYMKSAYIHDASITNAKIANLAVDDAKVANLSAAKVTFGEMHGDRITANTLNADRINVTNLAAKMAAITTAYVGTANITTGSITNALIGNVIQSDSYVAGSAGWKIDKAGAMEMNNATFRGALSGATGSFAGSLSAAIGTFRGAVNVGAFTGYSWPAAGNYGAHLSASGLMIGNANSGYYFQVDQYGNVYSPGFKVEWGTLTISQLNVINTANIAGQAVTIPVSAYTAAGISVGSAATVTVQTAAITSTGAPVLIVTSALDSNKECQFTLKRDGTVTLAVAYGAAPNVTDVAAGYHVYTLEALNTGTSTATVSYRLIALLETKR